MPPELDPELRVVLSADKIPGVQIRIVQRAKKYVEDFLEAETTTQTTITALAQQLRGLTVSKWNPQMLPYSVAQHYVSCIIGPLLEIQLQP